MAARPKPVPVPPLDHKILTIIRTTLEDLGVPVTAAEITKDAKLSDDLHLDSLDQVELAMLLEEQLKIEFDDEGDDTAETFETGTVGDVIALCKARGAAL